MVADAAEATTRLRATAETDCVGWKSAMRAAETEWVGSTAVISENRQLLLSAATGAQFQRVRTEGRALVPLHTAAGERSGSEGEFKIAPAALDRLEQRFAYFADQMRSASANGGSSELFRQANDVFDYSLVPALRESGIRYNIRAISMQLSRLEFTLDPIGPAVVLMLTWTNRIQSPSCEHTKVMSKH